MSKAIGKKKSLAKPVKLKTKAEKNEKKAAKSQPSKKPIDAKKSVDKKQIHAKVHNKSNVGKAVASAPAKKSAPLKQEVVKKHDVKSNAKDVKKESSAPQKSSAKDQSSKASLAPIKEKESAKTHPKATAAAVSAAPAKKAAAQASAKKSKTKKDETEMDADFLVGDDDLGTSEIAEYEEELKAVEEEDDDLEQEVVWVEETKESKDTEVFLTDAEGRRLCRARDCDQAAAVDQYCRYHYLLLWKKIQNRRKILADGKLEKYVDDLTSRYPDKYLETIRKDLRTEKDFMAAIQELELDESANNEMEFEEDSQSFAEEIRGMGESTAVEDDEY